MTKKKNMNRKNPVASTYDTYSLHALHVAFKNAVELTTLT